MHLQWLGLLGRATDVEDFHEDREAHGGVDVALVDVGAHAVDHEREADEQQEGERQHLQRGVPIDDAGDVATGHSITRTAMTTAAIMIATSSTMPTAVMTESRLKMTSRIMFWAMTLQKEVTLPTSR